MLCLSHMTYAKGLVAKLTPPHVQSAWRSTRESVRVAGLTACCNYLSKKKKSHITYCCDL